MLPTRSHLEQLAASTGFQPRTLEKVERLADLLELVGGDPVLAGCLVLKGGTALNLLFGPPQRLSVDLDFNLATDLAAGDLTELRAEVERRIEVLAQRRRYRLQSSPPAHAARTFHLSYTRAFDGGADQVKLDINYIWRIPLLPTESRPVHLPGARLGPQVRCLAFDELAAGKVVALLDRTTARDLWDVARLVQLGGGGWPSPLSRPLLVAYSGTLPKPLTDYTADRVRRRVVEQDVHQNLAPMLLPGASLDTSGLLDGALGLLAVLLDLEPAEALFCSRLQRGELDAALLFPHHPELAARVARCPPLQWKAQNAAAYHGQTSLPL
jgi:predicted nucleotidyltransferase component of viral defense system